MTNIPTTAADFKRWLEEQNGLMPPELYSIGLRALFALNAMNQKAFNESEVMQRECAKDLMAFAEAYGAWKAKR